MDSKKLLLGEKSYPVIVEQINEKIKNAQCSTLEGNQFLSKMFKTLNESSTPIMDIKPFITGAEKVADDDTTLKEVIDFCKKSITTGDLNFLINLVKEEHFQNLKRMHHPAPEATIKDIKEKFDEPAGVIEQGIRSGLFDNLKSDLLNKIKVDLNIETKKLNESETMFKNSLISYNPVGIKIEDNKTNNIVLLLENAIITYNEDKSFKSLDKSQISISPEQNRLMTAINYCSYNPELNQFSLNENWDFNMVLDSNGDVLINDIQVKKEHLKDLLLESIQLYKKMPPNEEISKSFNETKYLKDADNFIMLVENQQHLIQFDNLVTIKNLNENEYIILSKDDVFFTNNPEIITSSRNYNTKLYESYNLLIEDVNSCLKENISDLFEPQLINEKQILQERDNSIKNLNESISKINHKLKDISNLKNIAEENSPALTKLNEQENMLNKALDKKLNDLNFYVNEFKLY